jgi:hypothetical protein
MERTAWPYATTTAQRKRLIATQIMHDLQAHGSTAGMKGKYSFPPRRSENSTWMAGAAVSAIGRYRATSVPRIRNTRGGPAHVTNAGGPY